MNDTHIYLAFANGQGEQLLPALKAEQEGLTELMQNKLDDGYKWGSYDSEPRLDIPKLISKIRKRKNSQQAIHIFHFGGHSGSEGLQLLNDKGDLSLFHKENLSNIFDPLVKEKIRLFFLNGCANEELVKGLMNIGIPAIIATQSKIPDAKAKDFALHFYDSLFSGYNLRQAFNTAKAYYAGEESQTKVYYKDYREDGTGEDEEDEVEFEWGLYIQKGQEAIEDWTIKAGTDEGFKLYREFKNASGKEKILLFDQGLEDSKDVSSPYFKHIEFGIRNQFRYLGMETDQLPAVFFYSYSSLSNLSPNQRKEILNETRHIFWPFFYLNQENLAEEAGRNSELKGFLKRAKLFVIVCDGEYSYYKSYVEMEPWLQPANKHLFRKSMSERGGIWKEFFDAELKEILRFVKEYSDDYEKSLGVFYNAIKMSLHFEDQRESIKELKEERDRKFKLVLIEGSKNCAQELLVKYIIKISQEISLEDHRYQPISLEEINKSGEPMEKEKFFSIIAQNLRVKLGKDNVEQDLKEAILNKLRYDNLILIFNDVMAHHKGFLSNLAAFWNLFASSPATKSQEEFSAPQDVKHLFVFAIYKGLDSQEQVDENTWGLNEFGQSPESKIKNLPVIKMLDKNVMERWKDINETPFKYINEALLKIFEEEQLSEILKVPRMHPVISEMARIVNHPEISYEVINLTSSQ